MFAPKSVTISNIEPVEVTQWFIDTMKMAYTRVIRINTESSRPALIVDHVLMELNQHVNISFFLENTFNVDSSKGLTGNPDGIITNNDNQLYITSPVVVFASAKKSDLGSGFAQCIAEMEAARRFNEKEGNNIPTSSTDFIGGYSRLTPSGLINPKGVKRK